MNDMLVTFFSFCAWKKNVWTSFRKKETNELRENLVSEQEKKIVGDPGLRKIFD